jgi:amidophosphoribosyltransferase
MGDCGVFGLFGAPNAAELTYLGLRALQHRGQESAGIAVSNGRTMEAHLDMGLVEQVFKPEDLARLVGDRALGHVRYSTTGSSTLKNCQPLVADTGFGRLAIAHNGNLVNSQELKADLLKQGHLFPIFTSTTDTEIILVLVARGTNLRRSVKEALQTVRGAYSVVFLHPEGLIAARDPNGFRPLVLGRLPNGGHAVSSETCAFDLIGAETVRDVAPGEILHIGKEGLRSEYVLPRKECRPSHCLFEYVYFARPDSTLDGDNVHQVRKALGRRLAIEHPVAADLVAPIPDSGNSAALGYSEQSGIRLEQAYVRNHYVGRTFIQPSSGQRDIGVKIKLNALKDVVRGRRVIVVDDSIIRGTTSRSRVKLLREAGAKEVHLRISCPPTRHPCFYGIDFPTHGQLIASAKSVEQVAQFIGADSLGYLSLEGLRACVSGAAERYCTACWSGHYPVPPQAGFDKLMFEKAETT